MPQKESNMQVKYICANKRCRYQSDHPYELVVSTESIMDEKNIATFFCPHCNEKLKCDGEGCLSAA